MKTLGQIIEEWGYFTEKKYFIGIVKQWLEEKRQKYEWMTDSESALTKIDLIDELIKEFA